MLVFLIFEINLCTLKIWVQWIEDNVVKRKINLASDLTETAL